MKPYQPFFEAPPQAAQSSRVYYHGTAKEDAGKAILRDGIRVPDLTGRKGKLKPVEGKVYITPSLEYAVIYTLGAAMIGEDMSGMIKPKGRDDQYGYLFAIDGHDLVDIQPDEDSVGEVLNYLLNDRKDGKFELSGLSWLVGFAQRYLTALQLQKVRRYDDYGDLAAAGKKLNKFFTDGQKLALIDAGSHVAHTGNLTPDHAWRFDKGKSEQLKYDGSNFFKLAEAIK